MAKSWQTQGKTSWHDAKAMSMMLALDYVARVLQKHVAGKTYLQVVEDYKDRQGRWKQKVLRSFGQYTPESYLKAVQYEAAVNAFKEAAPAQRQSSAWEPWEKAAAVIIGGVALGWLLSVLFEE